MTMRVLALGVVMVLGSSATAADWPQWMGPNRDAVWAEDGIVEQLPPEGLKPQWRAKIGGGYAGPAVAGGKVYVMDKVLGQGASDPSDPFDTSKEIPSVERVVCLDAASGKEVWKHEYQCPYKISYPAGPRCTPTVDEGKVYCQGAMGDLRCLDANTGKLIWSKNFPKDYGAKTPIWGFCGHPLVYGNLLIALVGGEGSVAVAFDKATGKEVWKALSAPEPGYAPPTIIKAAGVDQLIIWHANDLVALNPKSGETYWSVPLKPNYAMAIMAARQDGDLLYAAGNGGAQAVVKLAADKPGAEVVWREDPVPMGRKMPKRGLAPINMTPFIDQGVIYGVDQPGMMRAVRLTTGERLWFTFEPVIGREEDEEYNRAATGTAFLVRNKDRYFIFAETGDLIIATLSPGGYEEISRTKLLEPTGAAFGRKVVWTHPAFANKSIYVRNDQEIVCYSLAK